MKTDLNGVSIYYEICGEGFPLVLIAGLTARGDSWPHQIPEFRKHYQVITLDNRNAGRSDLDDRDYHIKTMARDVVSLMDRLGISSAHMVGRSMGGYIAQEIAIRYPEYVSRLVLSSTAPVSSTRNNLLFDHLLQLKEPQFDQKLLWKELIFWENSPLLLESAETLESAIAECLADPHMQTLRGFRNQIQAIKEHNALDRLPLIKAPTLVLYGEMDLLILQEESRVLADRIDGAVWECLPEAGHSVHNDRPTSFNRILSRFLAA